VSRTLSILARLPEPLAWFGAVALFVFSPAIGSIASVIAIAMAIVTSPAAMPRGFWTVADRSRLLALPAFAVLAVCLVVEVLLVYLARWTDGIVVVEVNLLVLLVASLAVVPANWDALRRQPAMLIFLAAFASLAICFQASAQQPGDIVLAANFLGLLLAPAAYLLARRRAGARTVLILSGLFVLGALVGALMGSYDVFVTHRDRAFGWAQGGNTMARTVVPLGFMALAGLFATTARWRWLYLLGLPLSLYALYLTGTRGVFIAVPLLGVIFLVALLRELRASRLWYVAGAVLLVAAVAAVGVVSPRFLGIGAVLEQVTLDASNVTDVATSQRLYMWEAGWHTFWKSPLIGFGFANFTEASKPYGIYMFHNDFLDMAVGAGLVGIFCWLAIVAAPVVGVLAMPRDRLADLRLYCALILSVSLFVFGLTDMTLGYDLPTTLYAFMTALVLGAFREPEPQVNPA
jgi:O-antigen ligase